MTLEEAIQVLTDERERNINYYSPTRKAAFTLGIEALKARKRDRYCRGNYVDNLLPGETKDI